jgi:hypothetical protein
VVSHRLPLDEGVSVVVPEGEHVLRARTFVADLTDARERLFCRHESNLLGCRDADIGTQKPTAPLRRAPICGKIVAAR